MMGYAEEAFKSHSDLSALSPAIHHVIHKPFKRSDFAYAIRQALDEEQ